MPRQRKPAYSLHKPTGQARVRINGKDRYLGKFGSRESRDRYDELIVEWIRCNGSTHRHSMTVDDLALVYMEHAQQHYRKNGKPTSELSCVKIALRVLVAKCGSKNEISELSSVQLVVSSLAHYWVRASFRRWHHYSDVRKPNMKKRADRAIVIENTT